MKKVLSISYDILTIALLSTFGSFLLFNIYQLLNIVDPFNIYLALIPILFILVLICINKNPMLSNGEEENKESPMLNYLYYGLGFSSLGYLLFLLFDIRLINYRLQIIICILLALIVIIRKYIIYHTEMINIDDKISETVPEKKNLFSIYYINISKVFEIAMLLNNKIMTSMAKEKMKESSLDSDEQLSIDINLKYLEEIAQGLSYNKGFQKTNSEKNRVLENFDVKTTKSNLLEVIIRKGKIYGNDSDLIQGDLVIFKDVQLTLINQKETMDVMKMLLNGAFNGTVISGESNEMQIELNMASLINSLLKDCVYELSCQMPNGDFLITIPMTFENDFENSYNIYDLLVGKVTIIGIYKGVETGEPYRSVFELFSQASVATKPDPLPNIGYDEENVDYSLTPSSKAIGSLSASHTPILVSASNDSTLPPKTLSKRKHIDVIAIIQEINSLD